MTISNWMMAIIKYENQLSVMSFPNVMSKTALRRKTKSHYVEHHRSDLCFLQLETVTTMLSQFSLKRL